MPYRFEWDSRKAAANVRKHGVSFDEGSTVFDDPPAAIFDDEPHSTTEVRELIIGHRPLVGGELHGTTWGAAARDWRTGGHQKRTARS